MCVDGQGCCCHRQGRVSIADPPRLWTQTSIYAWPLSVSSSSHPTLILIHHEMKLIRISKSP